MKRAAGTRWREALLALCLAGVAAVLGGCDRPPAGTEAAPEDSAAESPAPAAGRHPLTASPPVTAEDLDRLVGVGFDSDQIAAEIARRGVLRLPGPAEREHIRRLPRGDRLLDAMEAPANLLTAEDAARWGRRQAGVAGVPQQGMVYPVSGQVRTVDPRRRQQLDYQNKRSALTTRIAALKQQRAAMQQRGETGALIGLEIDRLQRELDDLVPPR